MIELRFHPDDLADIRFAFSPLVEIAMSLRVLRDSARHALHRPWVRRAERRLEGFDSVLLDALVPTRSGYIPDFLAPPPDSPVTDFETALDIFRSTDTDVVRREVEKVAYDRPDVAEVLRPLLGAPAEGMEELAASLVDYWNRVLAEHWSHMLDALEGEVLWRARRLAVEGAPGLFDGLHRAVEYGDAALRVYKPHEETLDLEGRGLLLIPTVFAWPDVFVVTDRPWRPTLWYPARGIGWLWDELPPNPSRALERLVGRARSRVLQSLRAPTTTRQVARRLGLSQGTVSEHLGRLQGTGLVGKTRVGRRVFYALTAKGIELMRLLGADDATRPPETARRG